MTSAGEISVHVTINEKQVKEAARLAARLFRSEYASAIIAGDVDEDRVQVDDEPPHIGAQVTNADGVIAERFEEGWRWRHLSTNGGWCWGGFFDWDIIAFYSPLYLTTDEERRAADLPVGNDPCVCLSEEPCRVHDDIEDVTEEPPERSVNVTITDVFAVPDEHGYLRINVGPETAVIDQNASNVTVTDVDITDDMPVVHDPETGERVTWSEVARDVDPNEALAKVIFGEGFSSHEGLRLAQLDVARAAREHIEDEMDKCYAKEDATAHDRAEKAEAERDEFRRARDNAYDLGDSIAARHWADVERLTRERDDAIERSVTSRSALVEARAAVLRLTRERDEARVRTLEMQRLHDQKHDRAVGWKGRHEALRADVEGRCRNAPRWADPVEILTHILDRDDERGQQ